MTRSGGCRVLRVCSHAEAARRSMARVLVPSPGRSLHSIAVPERDPMPPARSWAVTVTNEDWAVLGEMAVLTGPVLGLRLNCKQSLSPKSLSYSWRASPRSRSFPTLPELLPHRTHRGGNGKPLPRRTAGAAWVSISSAASSGDVDVAC